TASDLRSTVLRFSLSPRERAGVSGKEPRPAILCTNHWMLQVSFRLRAAVLFSARNQNLICALRSRAVVFLAAVAWALLAGRERKSADPSTRAPETAPQLALQTPGTNAAGVAAEMIRLPGGRFKMGNKDEVDAAEHEVVVSAFQIDKYLVTQELFQKVVGANP